MSCEQCSGICSSHGTCLSASVLPVEAETPSWNEFAGMHLLWPGAMCLRLRLFGTRRLEVASGNKWKGDPQVIEKRFFLYTLVLYCM